MPVIRASKDALRRRSQSAEQITKAIREHEAREATKRAVTPVAARLSAAGPADTTTNAGPAHQEGQQ